MQVAGLVAELGRDGEGPGRALGGGRGGDETRVVQGQGVEAHALAGGGRRGEFVVEGADAVGGREGEVGVLVGLDATGHGWSGVGEGEGRGER